MKILNGLFNILSWIVIAAIVIYMAIAAPLILKYRPVVILSGSMEPAYHVGSIIYYHDVPFEELEEGNAITFKAGESLVTHRITKINGLSRTVVTKGDNNSSEDPVPVEENEIVGKATDFSIPYGGYFVMYGKHPVAIATMAGILIINYFLDHIVSEREGEKTKHEKKE